MKKTCISYIIKLFAKIKNAKKILLDAQKIFFLEQSSKIQNFIVQLINILRAGDKNDNNTEVISMQTREKIKPRHENF